MAIIDLILRLLNADIEVFVKYPLSASLITLSAFLMFLASRSKDRDWFDDLLGKRRDISIVERLKRLTNDLSDLFKELGPLNVFIFLVLWSVVVPILGLILEALSKLGSTLTSIVSDGATSISFFYSIFSRHPILFTAIVAIAIVVYVLPNRWWPVAIRSLWDNQLLKACCFLAAIALILCIAAPFADTLEASPRPAKDTAPAEKHSLNPQPAFVVGRTDLELMD